MPFMGYATYATFLLANFARIKKFRTELNLCESVTQIPAGRLSRRNGHIGAKMFQFGIIEHQASFAAVLAAIFDSLQRIVTNLE